MLAATERPGPTPSDRDIPLPASVEAEIWRGTDLGVPLTHVVPTGWAELDRELPGGGWPGHNLTEILQAQPSVCEWRVLAPALQSIVSVRRPVVVVGAPKTPHLPGLMHSGLAADHLVWIQAETPFERLWAAEQVLKSKACGALLAWLPQARAEQLRRLQVCAQGLEGPAIVFRPRTAQSEASPAPLRLEVSCGLDWTIDVRVLKRKGAPMEGLLRLPSIPGGLADVLTPRLRHPSRLVHTKPQPRMESANDVLGSSSTRNPTPFRAPEVRELGA